MVCAIYYVHTILRDFGCQFKMGSPDAYDSVIAVFISKLPNACWLQFLFIDCVFTKGVLKFLTTQKRMYSRRLPE